MLANKKKGLLFELDFELTVRLFELFDLTIQSNFASNSRPINIFNTLHMDSDISLVFCWHGDILSVLRNLIFYSYHL